MKKQPFAPLLLAALSGSLLLFSACQKGAGKFAGKWQPADSATLKMLGNDLSGHRLVVEEVAGQRYAMYPENSPADSLVYQYELGADRLVSTRNGATFYMRVNPQSGHLLLTVEAFPDQKLELQRAD